MSLKCTLKQPVDFTSHYYIPYLADPATVSMRCFTANFSGRAKQVLLYADITCMSSKA